MRALIAGIFDELKPMNVTTNVAGLRQVEREDLLKAIAAADAAETLQVDRQTVERTVLSQIDKWRQLFCAKRLSVHSVVGQSLASITSDMSPKFDELAVGGRIAPGYLLWAKFGPVTDPCGVNWMFSCMLQT